MPHFIQPSGLWLPLVTPFKEGKIDESSLGRLVSHFASKGISGIILAATTGEGQLLTIEELQLLCGITAGELSASPNAIPLYLGISGSDPVQIIQQVNKADAWAIDGYMICGPNYLRPSQRGVFEFYKSIAQSTDKPVLIYNIPYRTGVNIENETMLKLAGLENIVGVKDCCGNADQSYELIRNAPKGFSVMTGEDPFVFNAFANGAPGAIVTGAHVLADAYLGIISNIQNGNLHAALETWNSIAHIPAFLFAEPNPSPLKYWLWRQKLIDTPEVRLPFVPISTELEQKIDAELAASQGGN